MSKAQAESDFSGKTPLLLRTDQGREAFERDPSHRVLVISVDQSPHKFLPAHETALQILDLAVRKPEKN